VRDGPSSLASFLADSATEVRDAFGGEALAAAIRLMSRYADVPMDFPDATLVWIAELSGTDQISARFYIVSIPKEPPVQIAAGAIKPFVAQHLPPRGFLILRA
jgi:hypothetical protein